MLHSLTIDFAVAIVVSSKTSKANEYCHLCISP